MLSTLEALAFSPKQAKLTDFVQNRFTRSASAGRVFSWSCRIKVLLRSEEPAIRFRDSATPPNGQVAQLVVARL